MPPAPSSKPTYNSDALAQLLSLLKIPYLALVPGSSFRGLHDSLVNFSTTPPPSSPSSHSRSPDAPELLTCLHEEHAIALAHGYSKVAGRALAVATHANVGLMHASMAIYNAWCDRAPVLVLGANGPGDAGRRRPWIDWIHSSEDPGALVRAYVKFDDQPRGVDAAVEAILRAWVVAGTRPRGPTYVCLDVEMQEEEVRGEVRVPEVGRYADAMEGPGRPAAEDVLRVSGELERAGRVVFLFGRVNRDGRCWDERVRLAERFDARVVTDLKQAAAFPTGHGLHQSPPGVFVAERTSELIRSADLIVSFDWVDLGGTMKAAVGYRAEPGGRVVHISMDSVLHNGWSKDHFALPPADVACAADPDLTLSAVLAATEGIPPHVSAWPTDVKSETGKEQGGTGGDICMSDLATALYTVCHPDDMCIVRLPLGWVGSDLRATHPLAFLGMDGGAGVGSGPGMVVGAALAIKDERPGLIPVGILGDGDFLMGNSAIWTAAKYRIPMLIIVANNASYFNDEAHQERVAKHRGRPVENKGVGVRLDDPAPNLHEIARGFGCTVVRNEQVRQPGDLVAALRDAVEAVRAGEPVVLDARVLPEGYSSAMSDQPKTVSS